MCRLAFSATMRLATLPNRVKLPAIVDTQASSKLDCLPGVGVADRESLIVSSLLLAWVSTIAGNFTLFGSVANLIVAEKAKRHINYSLGFFSYLLFGLFSTFVVLFVGLPIVYFLGKLASGI